MANQSLIISLVGLDFTLFLSVVLSNTMIALLFLNQFKQQTNNNIAFYTSWTIFNKICHSDWEFERRAKREGLQELKASLKIRACPRNNRWLVGRCREFSAYRTVQWSSENSRSLIGDRRYVRIRSDSETALRPCSAVQAVQCSLGGARQAGQGSKL